MQIFVDADACPVVAIVERIAKENSVPVTLLCDTNHVLSSDYSEVVVVGAGADAVDYKLISICHKGDIVVSQDYGVAAMALGKGAYAIHQSGRWYTNDNIDQMLMAVYPYLSLVTETDSRFAGSKSVPISGASSSVVKFC